MSYEEEIRTEVETEKEPTPLEVSIKWVNAYEHYRDYGGPEEGGWWYEQYVPLQGIPVEEKDVEEAKKRLLRIYKEEYDGVDLNSVLSIGKACLEIFVEDHPPRLDPEERPYYE